MTSKPLNTIHSMLYAAPWNAYAFIILPLGVVLPTYYAEATLADMVAIGLVSGIARLFDAFTDPFIGYISDRTHTRLGARKPWILLGSFIACVSIFFLFQPPPDAGITYYAVFSIALYLGFTMFDIPHKAWYTEVTTDYNDRSRLASYVAIFTAMGSLLFWIVPIALSPFTGTTEIGGESLEAIAWLFIIVLPLSILGAVVYVPNGRTVSGTNTGLREVFASVKSNKPFLRFVGAMGLWAFGQGVHFSLVFLIMRDYLGLGEQFAVLMIISSVIQLFAMPLWAKLMNRFSKHRTWAFSWAFGALWTPLLLLFEPGSAPFWPVLGFMLIGSAINAASWIAPRAVLGDVIDYDILRTKTNNAGKYFSVNTLLDKMMIGVGVGFSFPILSLFGYEIGGENDSLAIFGLLFCYLGLPLFTHVGAAAILWNFPIDARRHAIIKKRIDQLTERNEIVMGN